MTPREATAKNTGRRVNPLGRAHPARGLEPADAAPDDYPELVRAAASGDAIALERLLMRAQEAAWRFSTSVCGHADDAEDAMQEALLKTYRHVGRLREPGAFRPWLYRTVRNACLMGRRKRVGEPAHLQSLDDTMATRGGSLGALARDPGKNPEQLADNAGLRRRLRTALAALPPTYRAVLFLREMEGLSTREVAAVLGTSEANVKTRLHRARAQLQVALDGARR